jgi:hypothetical protein
VANPPEEVIEQARRYADRVADLMPKDFTDEDRRLVSNSTFIAWIQCWRQQSRKENSNA